jgi:hypothetical protein
MMHCSNNGCSNNKDLPMLSSMIHLPSAIALAAALLLSMPMLSLADDPAAGIIDDDLFEGLEPAPAATEPAARTASELPAGEDIDLGRTSDPFARIATKMQRSRQALGAGDSSAPTQQLQQEILSDLDELLKQVQKQCSGGQCNKPGTGSSAGNSNAGNKPSNKPANDSTARVGEPGDGRLDQGDTAEAMREVWGHLPPKVREAMQNASIEEFLPKYDKLIEDFYRRLAEQPPRGG